MRVDSGVAAVFYNKPLLRLIEFVLFLALGTTGFLYLSQSFLKLGLRGVLDALAIYSFVVAAFLFVLVAEVVDSHYLRLLSSLITFVGMFVAFRWIFQIDAPHLEPGPMQIAMGAFIVGMVLALFYFFLIVSRLVADKVRAVTVAKVHEAGVTQAPAAAEAPAVEPASEATMPSEEAAPAAVAVLPSELKLTAVAGPYLGQSFALSRGENLIGRKEGAIVLADDAQVSRRHCVIVWDDSGLSLRDLRSTNGSWVNGQRVSEAKLHPGDVLALGQSQFKLE